MMKRVDAWVENQSSNIALINGDKTLSYAQLNSTDSHQAFGPVLTYLRQLNPQTDPVVTLKTSGTTGLPKEIPIAQTALRHQLHHWPEIIPPEHLKRTLLLTNLEVDLAFMELLYPLSQGQTVVIYPQDKKAPKEILSFMNANQITFAQWTPSLLQMMTSLDLTMPSLKTLLISGDTFTRNDIEPLLSQNPHLRILNGYGPTECGYVTFEDVTQKPTITLGKPYGQTQLNIINGVLHVKSPQTLTPNQWFNTGDIVEENHQGELIFKGRIDNQIKWRGRRLELDEVTQCLIQHPHITSAKTYLDPSKNHLVSEVNSHNKLTHDEVHTYLKTHLDPWKIPNEIISYPTDEPSQDAQISLQQLAADILKRPVQDIDDHKTFFQLGGDSIQAFQLIHTAKKRGIHLTFKTLLSTPLCLTSPQTVKSV